MNAALEGVRVLDLTRYIPGPYCTMLLGDLGADVVKVEEPPGGDPVRGLPPAAGEDSAVHAALNRNKRSVAVDIRDGSGAEVVRRLAARADVLVEGWRPGVLAARGLGADTLRAANPGLVYCSITGYGQQGEAASRAGHDINYAALSGFLGTNRAREGRPVIPGAQVADVAGGLVAALGILAALHGRTRSGRGDTVDVSLTEAALTLLSVPMARLLAGGGRTSELTGDFACYNVYRCRDGRYLSVGALEPKFWERLCRALGRPDLVGRQWKRGEAARETRRTLEEAFGTRDRDGWVEDLRARDVCVEPVLDLEETPREPAVARAMAEWPGVGGAFRALGSPLRLGEATAPRRPPPRLGEHTDAVLAEAGYAAAEIASLRARGAVA